MTEHAWVQEHIAAFVAGGLEAAEVERIQGHVSSCPECTRDLHHAGAFDHQMTNLLADTQPGPDMEERLLHSLRASRRWRRRSFPGLSRLSWPAAAAAVLVICGAGLGLCLDPDKLPFPGDPTSSWINGGLDISFVGGSVFGDVKQRDRGANILQGWLALPRLSSIRDGATLRADLGCRNEISQIAPSLSAFQEGDETRSNQPRIPSQTKPVVKGTSRVHTWNDPEVETNYNVDRLAETSVPGRVETGKTGVPLLAEGLVMPKPPAPGIGHGTALDLYGNSATSQEKTNKGGRTDRKVDPLPEAKPEETRKTPEKPPSGTPSSSSVRTEDLPPAMTHKVIRTGEIEFEVESYDAAVATATKLVLAIKGAFIASDDSKKLPNGKVRGSLVVRVPPDNLDGLVLDLRKELGQTGELKGQRIGSQDITKQYTDLESRLRAARTMEERLLQIIKTGKGEVKDLLSAEKELGVWRTKIEEMEGELRYYAHQVALSTLTIQLTEKEIRAAAAVLETEKVQMGLEVEDVDKAFREAREAVDAAKGRVTRSEVKQPAAGQFSAVLEFEVAPEAAGPLRDRLKQIGTLARLDINRVQKAEAGSEAIRTAPVRRGDTQFNVHIYNLTTVTPRETAVIQLAVPDVPAGFQALRDAVAKAKGRVINAQLNEQDRQNVNAQLDFEIRRTEEAMIQDALAKAGEIVSRTVTRAPEGESVTDTKVRLQMKVIAAAGLDPRETIQLALEVNDVDNTLPLFAALVSEVKGRSLQPQLTHERSGRVTARVVYDVPLLAAPALVEKFKTAGTVRLETFARNEKIPEGKLALARLEVTLANTELLIPKDEGLWSYIRTGLSTSLKFLSMSVTWLIFGLCVVLPWALLVMGGWWLVRRWWRRPATTPPTPNP
jgi:hypothetical protein